MLTIHISDIEAASGCTDLLSNLSDGFNYGTWVWLIVTLCYTAGCLWWTKQASTDKEDLDAAFAMELVPFFVVVTLADSSLLKSALVMLIAISKAYAGRIRGNKKLLNAKNKLVK